MPEQDVFKQLFTSNKLELGFVKINAVVPFVMVLERPSKGVVDEFLFNKFFFAPSETRIFERILKQKCDRSSKNPLVVDIGANIGYFTLTAAAFGCRVLALEPIPKAQSLIKYSMLLNGLEDRIELLEVVAGEKREMLNFRTVSHQWGLSHISKEEALGDTFPVQAVPLSELIHEDVLLLKIDVEGAEDIVWKGLEPVFDNYTIHNVLVEVKKLGDIEYKRQWINHRIETGYQVFSYAENYDQNGDLYDFEDIYHSYVDQLTPNSWIPFEDIWLSLVT